MTAELVDMPVGYSLRESVQLGAKFRRSGAEVEIGGFVNLPKTLQAALQRKMPYLVDLLGNGEDDGPITLLRNLGISAVLVETRQAARRAICNIIKASAQHSGPLGFDIETCPKPEYAKERPWAKFNKDGAFSDAQPSPKDYRDPAGVDPHRAYIATAQIYAGREHVFCLSR